MKALQLSHTLNKKERQAFETVIKNKGRKSLLLLWKYLLKYEGDKPDKSEMYQAAFKAIYNSDKDYLLRNELRLLSDELTDFILQREFEEEMKGNPNFRNARYLKALRRRNLGEVFLAEFDKLFTRADAEMQIALAEEMAMEKMLLLYRLLDSRSIANQVYETAESYIDWVTKRTRHSVRLSEFHRDIARSRWALDPINHNNLAPDVRPPRTSLDIRDNSTEHALTRFYSNFTKALHCESEERLKVLEAAYEAIEQCGFPDIEQLRFKAGCLNFLGITYHQMGDEKQFDIFRQALQLQEVSRVRSITQLMNYLHGLLNHKKIETFWAELEQFKHWFDDDYKQEQLHRIIQHAHVVSGSPDLALEYLNKLHQGSDEEYLVIKSALVAIYYHMKAYDLVQTESNNALHFLRTRNSKVFRYQCHELEFKLATLLARYQMALAEEKEAIRNRILELLHSSTPEFIQKMATTFLRSKWVIDVTVEITSGREMNQ